MTDPEFVRGYRGMAIDCYKRLDREQQAFQLIEEARALGRHLEPMFADGNVRTVKFAQYLRVRDKAHRRIRRRTWAWMRRQWDR